MRHQEDPWRGFSLIHDIHPHPTLGSRLQLATQGLTLGVFHLYWVMEVTPMEDALIIPCPFCGADGKSVEALLHVEYDGKTRYINCETCGAHGPSADTWEDAWDRWNASSKRIEIMKKVLKGVMGLRGGRVVSQDEARARLEMKDVTNGGSFYDQFKPLETIVVDDCPIHFGAGGADEWVDGKWESMTKEDRVKCLIRWEWSKIGTNG